MKTIQQTNNENQYQTALEGLNHYNGIVNAATYVQSATLDDDIADANKQIRKITKTIKALTGTLGIEDSIIGLEKNKEEYQKKLDSYIAQRESGGEVEEIEGIEYILNIAGTATDLILPLKKEDLENTLAGKIYTSVEEICKAYQPAEMAFESYLGFSLAEADRTELVARVTTALDNLGVTATAADNFTFTYDVSLQVKSEPVAAPVATAPIATEPVAPVSEPIELEAPPTLVVPTPVVAAKPAAPEPVVAPVKEEPLEDKVRVAPDAEPALNGRTYIGSAPELHQALDSLRNEILAEPDLKYKIVAERFEVVIKDFDLTDGSPKAKGKMAGYIANRVKKWNREVADK